MVKQLPAMDEDQRVPIPRRDHLRSDDGLTERSACCKYPYLVLEKRSCSLVLLGRQLSKEQRTKRLSLLALVLELGGNASMPEKAQSVVKTSSRQSDMFGKRLGTTDGSWLAKGRQAHGLCRIKFGILECGQPSEAVNHHWRKFCPLDINLIAQYDDGIVARVFGGGGMNSSREPNRLS